MKVWSFILPILLLSALTPNALDARNPRVASKQFTESYILAELFAQAIEYEHSVRVDRRMGMGGSGILFSALQSGEIDFYPEYTGTISEALLKDSKLRSFDELQDRLKDLGLIISRPLGFNNTYVLAVRKTFAEEHELVSISDLAKARQVRAAFSYEFMNREDGFYKLRDFYGLGHLRARGIEQSLAYEAIRSGQIDLMDAYSTDAKIARYGLRLLEDDRGFFPEYFAVVLARLDFVEQNPKLWKTLQKLEGSISETQMSHFNSQREIDNLSFEEVAAGILGSESAGAPPWVRILLQRTWEHFYLVFISLMAAILAGLPLGILSTRVQSLSQPIMGITGTLQTIPSLALLCFFIPFFGIGVLPSLLALFLYGLLPIVRNVNAGLNSIPIRMIEVAEALGLSSTQRLRELELPMASMTILAGIKTSAVINVGTATLAAFIGAGGYGAYIVTGLALNDMPLILMGAVPAAIFAILLQGLFELLDRWIVPKALRLKS